MQPATLVVFDVLHLDGRAVGSLAYAGRRSLLRELLGDGETWRLAPSWTDRLDDVLAVTGERELEGVVFKRVYSVYRPGRRSSAWRKHKHRRTETLSVMAWAPGDGRPDSFYLARLGADGELAFARAVQLGLDGPARERLRAAVTEREQPVRRRQAIRAVKPGVALVVSSHRPAGGPLRDALIRRHAAGGNLIADPSTLAQPIRPPKSDQHRSSSRRTSATGDPSRHRANIRSVTSDGSAYAGLRRAIRTATWPSSTPRPVSSGTWTCSMRSPSCS